MKMKILTDQSTHTGVALVAVIVLLGHIAGVDIGLLSEQLSKKVVDVLAIVGTISGLLKIGLPESPKSAETAKDNITKLAETLGPTALRKIAEQLESRAGKAG